MVIYTKLLDTTVGYIVKPNFKYTHLHYNLHFNTPFTIAKSMSIRETNSELVINSPEESEIQCKTHSVKRQKSKKYLREKSFVSRSNHVTYYIHSIHSLN